MSGYTETSLFMSALRAESALGEADRALERRRGAAGTETLLRVRNNRYQRAAALLEAIEYAGIMDDYRAWKEW